MPQAAAEKNISVPAGLDAPSGRDARSDEKSTPPAKLRWLRKDALTEFAQFAIGRIERTPFPMGGYVYIVRDNGRAHYMGNDLKRALHEIRVLSK